MGSEILGLFIPIPILIWGYEIVCIVRNKHRTRHILLLCIGLVALGYMSLTSYLGGFHPMQGFIIGSFFYLPGFVVAWLGYYLVSRIAEGASNAT